MRTPQTGVRLLLALADRRAMQERAWLCHCCRLLFPAEASSVKLCSQFRAFDRFSAMAWAHVAEDLGLGNGELL